MSEKKRQYKCFHREGKRRNTGISTQGANRASSRPVAEDVLYHDVARWALWSLSVRFLNFDTQIYLDCHAFILVGDFDIVNPNVVPPDVKPIKAALVSTTNHHVVDFAISACIQRQMILRSFS
jgi:hypothetical protein